MRILSRYFLASYLKFFAVILVSSTIAITAIELMLNFESVVEHRNGSFGFATYLLLRIPSYYFRDLIPITCFAAAFCCTGLPARNHEITAIKSGGISPRRTVIPLLCAAAAISCGTLILNESLVLQASRAWARETHPGGEVAFREDSFWYRRGSAIYSVQGADREARLLHGVQVYDLSPRGRLRQAIWAERVEVEDEDLWRFRDAISRTFDPARSAALPRIERLSEWNREVTRESDLEMLATGARTLSLRELEGYIEAQSRAGRNTDRYRAVFHTRLSLPFTVFLLTLLAVPLGFSVGYSRSLAAATLSGIVVLALFYTTRTAAEILASKGLTSAVVSSWMILAVFGCFGAWQYLRPSR